MSKRKLIIPNATSSVAKAEALDANTEAVLASLLDNDATSREVVLAFAHKAKLNKELAAEWPKFDDLLNRVANNKLTMLQATTLDTTSTAEGILFGLIKDHYQFDPPTPLSLEEFKKRMPVVGERKLIAQIGIDHKPNDYSKSIKSTKEAVDKLLADNPGLLETELTYRNGKTEGRKAWFVKRIS